MRVQQGWRHKPAGLAGAGLPEKARSGDAEAEQVPPLNSVTRMLCKSRHFHIVFGRLAETQTQEGNTPRSSPVLELGSNTLELVLESSKSLGPNYSTLDDQVKLGKWLCHGPTCLADSGSCSSSKDRDPLCYENFTQRSV